MTEIVEAAQKHVPDLVSIEQVAFTPPWSENALINEIKRDDALFKVAVQNGEVLGFCILRLISGEAELFQIAVADKHRRSGIGSRLLDSALAVCAQNETYAVYLEVRQGNEGAIKLYEKHGFSCSGHRKNYYSNPAEDAVIMVLDLKQQI